MSDVKVFKIEVSLKDAEGVEVGTMEYLFDAFPETLLAKILRKNPDAVRLDIKVDPPDLKP